MILSKIVRSDFQTSNNSLLYLPSYRSYYPQSNRRAVALEQPTSDGSGVIEGDAVSDIASVARDV